MLEERMTKTDLSTAATDSTACQRTQRPGLTAWIAVVAAFLALGCAQTESAAPEPTPTPATSQAATLELLPGGADAGAVSVDLYFTLGANQTAPRMMELFVEPSLGLDFVDGEALAATTSAGKDLTVQAQADGTVRVLIFATGNLNTLGSGPLARLRFAKPDGPASVALRDRRPVFAPPGADQGITLGAPLALGGH